jgi:dTDP-glucose 4,6-dehydratase
MAGARGLRRILVTGGAGFIGSHICQRLLDEGCAVIAFDNLTTGSIDNIEPLLGHPRFEFQHYDVTNFLYVEGELDAILHFASPASPADFERLPIEILKVGSLGTHKALGLAKEKRARFLLASTSECYGDPEVNPQPESYWGNVNPVGIRGVYDEAKRFAEAMSMAYHRHHAVDVRIARIFNTFGPRMQIDDGRAIPNFFRQAIRGESVTLFGDGSQTRSFMYVDDLIEGVWRLLGSSYVGPVNLGNPEEMTLRAMADKIIAITGSASALEKLPLPPDDPKVRRPDISLARDVLGGWEPKISIEEGLRRTCDYFVTALARREERDRRDREQREGPGGERRRDPARRRATERKEPRP